MSAAIIIPGHAYAVTHRGQTQLVIAPDGFIAICIVIDQLIAAGVVA